MQRSVKFPLLLHTATQKRIRCHKCANVPVISQCRLACAYRQPGWHTKRAARQRRGPHLERQLGEEVGALFAHATLTVDSFACALLCAARAKVILVGVAGLDVVAGGWVGHGAARGAQAVAQTVCACEEEVRGRGAGEPKLKLAGAGM